MRKMRDRRYRAQGLHPDTGTFTETFTDDYSTAKRHADNLYFGEVRENSTNRVLYRDGEVVAL